VPRVNPYGEVIRIVREEKRIAVAELCRRLGVTYHHCRYSILKPIVLLYPEIVLVKENGVEYVEFRPKG